MPNWNSGGFSPISTYSGHLSFLQTVANGLRAVYPDPAVRRLATTKSISNDLNRLYRMQFLSRKRRKRQVVTAKGTICCKGFTYEYHLNKQGISYCEYLRRPKFDRDLQQKIRRKEITLKESFTYFIMKEAGEMIGPANGIALLKIAEYLSSYLSVQLFNRRFKRFPPPRDDELF